MKNNVLVFLFFLPLLSGCFEIQNRYSALPPGKWRAVLKLQPELITPNPKGQPLPDKVDMTYADVKENEVPFIFEVVYDNDTSFHIDILNGEERITVPARDIHFGRSKNRAQDTVRIDFPIYSSYITASYAGNVIAGQWVVANRENYAIPFEAIHGQDYRFTPLRKPPAADLTGKWAATFGLAPDDEEDPYPAIGEFQQQGNHLTGTFLTETGDYRYLEGTVQANKLYLSCFDGAHAYLFTGKILPDSTLSGAFFSGKHYRTTWDARRNANARLADPDSLTTLLPGSAPFTFSFKNPEGRVISLNNPEYRGKAKIIQIMGTWCPNCRDETAFLKEYLDAKKPSNVAIIGLSFEKFPDSLRANQVVRTYRERFNLPYEVVWAGSNKKEKALEVLPMLSEIFAFPTLIFLDKNNRVVKIHTGFSGPATSEYASFKQNFDKFVAQL